MYQLRNSSQKKQPSRSVTTTFKEISEQISDEEISVTAKHLLWFDELSLYLGKIFKADLCES